jgi:diguanylate cyclase (GGDEF)-like protein/PAS domain S-box-containing protein
MTKSLARKKLEGRLIGGNYSDLANYSALFERTHDGILLLDPARFEILQANPACAALLGAAQDDLVGQELPLYFDEFTRARLATFLKQASTATLDLLWSSTRGRVQLELSVSTLQLADYCTVLQLIVRDVTALRERQARLERLSLTDELTGLPNRRAFNDRLAELHASNRPYTVLLLDVDHFKHFNDRNGHAAGDVALQAVARVLLRHAGDQVFVARYGGEEFVAIVHGGEAEGAAPDAAQAIAQSVAESIRQAVQSARVPHGEHQPLGCLSVSIGGCLRSAGLTAEQISKQSDDALYASKEGGRNRVTFARASDREEK